MLGNAYLIVLSITVVVSLILMLVIRRPAKTSTNGSSSTLGLAKLSLFFIFVVVILDTMNDVVPQHQLVPKPTPATKSQPVSKKGVKPKRVVRRSRRQSTEKKRDVSKDKYWLLGFVFLICMGSYIARHPRVAEFWERIAAAWKGNPIPNQSDSMEDFMVTYLLQHQDPEHEEWFLRAMVAKRGGNPFEGMEKTPPPDEPIIIDPEEGLEGFEEQR